MYSYQGEKAFGGSGGEPAEAIPSQLPDVTLVG